MSDIYGDAPGTAKCSQIVHEVSIHVLNNPDVLHCLAHRFGVVGAPVTREYIEARPELSFTKPRGDDGDFVETPPPPPATTGDTDETPLPPRGLWVVCINSDLDTALSNKKCIEDALLSGEPFALEFMGTRVASDTSKVNHPTHSDKHPFNVNWADACMFITDEEVRRVASRLLHEKRRVLKEAEERGTKRPMNYSVPFGFSPLARMIVDDGWPELQFMMQRYDPCTSSAVLVGAMSFKDPNRFHARALIARFAKPTTFADAGEWKFGHVTSLLAEYMMEAMFACGQMNEARRVAHHSLQVAANAAGQGRTLDAPKDITITNINDIICSEFSRILRQNDALKPGSPASMYKIVSPTCKLKLDVTCFLCDTPSCTKKCSKCRLYRYCSEACQKRHWTGEGLPLWQQFNAHRRICPMARSFVLAVSQISVTRMTPEIFDHCRDKAVMAVHAFAENAVANKVGAKDDDGGGGGGGGDDTK